MQPDPALALALTIIVAAIYVVVLRLIDINEKEPLWALGLVLFLGAMSAGILALVTGSPLVRLDVGGAAVVEELAKFVALGVGVALLGVIGGLRGFSEVNGLSDGIVYGAAAGLGFAVGDTLVGQLSGPNTAALLGVEPFTVLWTTALVGLAQGVFGAITGAGIGAAIQARNSGARIALPVVGLVAAIIVHYAYLELGRGSALAGEGALLRAWLAILIPVALVAVAIVTSLARERRTISDELADEVGSGTVSDDELRLLRNPSARRGEYARRFFSGDFDGWLAMRELQNRQVQLALAKHRAGKTGDQGEVERLRVAIQQARIGLQAASDPSPGARAG